MSNQVLNRSGEVASSELALIGFIRERPRHGYEIYRLLVDTPELRRIWRMKQSRLYAILARLEDGGLLHSHLAMQTGRPPRKMYHPTESGAAEFGHWLTQPVAQPREMRLEFMLKLYFALREGSETARQLIAAQQTICATWPNMGPDPADGPFLSAVVAYRRAHIAAIRDWLASLLAEMPALMEPA